MKKILSIRIVISLMSLFLLGNRGFSQSSEELAKKLSNPIASLISVPLQNNSDFGIGEFKGSRNTLNIQPVIPIGFGDRLNLISRVILPVIDQYNITGEGERQTGTSDAIYSAFLSPSSSKNGLTWGGGPVLLLPTGSDLVLTTKKFGIGPTAVGLMQLGGVTLGALINQIWSVSGDENRPDVNQMFVQPFFVYNWKTGAGLGFNFEYTQNWETDQSTVWFNPVISGVTSLGKQKVQLAIGPRLNLVAPSTSRADWGVRAVVVFIFPKTN